MSVDPQLDDIDRAILELLRRDARQTISDIAVEVNLTAAPVRRRIDRLERLGVIAGYTVVLDHSRMGPTMEAFTELRLAGAADVEEVLAAVRRVPEVAAVYTTAGDPDALVHVRVDDVQNLRRVIADLRHSGLVTGTKTLMVVDAWVRPGSTRVSRAEPSSD